MKLLYITNQFCGSGGLERVLSIKASYLADNLGYDVHMLSLNQSDQPLFYNFSPKITCHDIKVNGNLFSYTYRYTQKLKKIIAKIKPDVISVCDDGLKGLLLPFVLDRKIPKIYERHVSKNIEIKTDNPTFLERFRTKITFSLMCQGAKAYDRFIVLTRGNATEWKIKNLEVIPNPLSFYPNEIQSIRKRKVLAVGRHAFQKGYDRLFQSWKSLGPEFNNWTLEIYGKIDREKRYINQAKDLGLQDCIIFYPPVKNIEEKYREAALYVMPSRFEGFGMVLIEAMAYGVPCISYDCPYGPGDIITDGIDGFLVDNGDIDLFTQRMKQLMNNPDLRKEMSFRAREKALQFSVSNVMPLWDKLFKGLVHA